MQLRGCTALRHIRHHVMCHQWESRTLHCDAGQEPQTDGAQKKPHWVTEREISSYSLSRRERGSLKPIWWQHSFSPQPPHFLWINGTSPWKLTSAPWSILTLLWGASGFHFLSDRCVRLTNGWLITDVSGTQRLRWLSAVCCVTFGKQEFIEL